MEASFFSNGLATLFILIQLTLYINTHCSAVRTMSSNEPDIQFIKTSCGTTRYPDLCFTTLSSYAAKIQGSPQLLAVTALSVALNATRSTSTPMKNLSKGHGLTPREAAAMHDCVEELSDAVDEIKRALGEMEDAGGKSFKLRINDVETWVSAALTDEDNCLDGFSGNVKETVRTHIQAVAHITSVALALVNSYAATQKHVTLSEILV